MKISETGFPGLYLIKPDVFGDARGYFFESFQSERYAEHGIGFEFKQDNLSKSYQGTVRGLHYQCGDYAQGKLCQVIEGEVLDVAVDIRWNSPTFGKYFSFLLSGENHFQLWIPPGFAHGFSVQSDHAIFHYKCTEVYHKPSERTILFNDHFLNIDWKVAIPIVSKKDLIGTPFDQIEKDFFYQP